MAVHYDEDEINLAILVLGGITLAAIVTIFILSVIYHGRTLGQVGVTFDSDIVLPAESFLNGLASAITAFFQSISRLLSHL